jgi:hypothetical protein
MLTSQAWDPDTLVELLQKLMDAPLRLLEANPEAYFSVCAHMIERRRILLQAIWTVLGDDDLRRRFLQVLLSFMRNPKRNFPPLPLDFLRSQLAGEGPEERRLFYRLLDAAGSAAAAEELTAALLREGDPELLALGTGALRRNLAGAAP